MLIDFNWKNSSWASGGTQIGRWPVFAGAPEHSKNFWGAGECVRTAEAATPQHTARGQRRGAGGKTGQPRGERGKDEHTYRNEVQRMIVYKNIRLPAVITDMS